MFEFWWERELGGWVSCNVCRELSGVLCIKFPTETIVVVHIIHCVAGIFCGQNFHGSTHTIQCITKSIVAYYL